jgi:hypothetical protein
MGTNLRQKQITALSRMLNFNAPVEGDGHGDQAEWSDIVSAS